MTHHVDHIRTLHAKKKQVFDVAEHCRRNGLDAGEEKKLRVLLGRYATRHELEMNTKHPDKARY